ncbi:MAG TPA: SdrD B-like domain-containing protein, partial [Gallionella sp.]|nr:SdrD B-like domain-containing protein [Gallionella sp.]
TVDNGSFGTAAAQNRVAAIKLPIATAATGYLFGERGGVLSGVVYVDANDNGAKDAGEAGIPGIAVTLSGTTTAGVDIATLRGCAATPANCISTTDAAGAFSFAGIPPGVYTLVEDQNQVDLVTDAAGTPQYKDGKETAGVAGGVVDNSSFGSQPSFNTIAAIPFTSSAIAANAGSIGGYLFGEVARPGGSALGLLPPVISGYVYADATHTRTRGAAVADPLVAGWNVTLTATRSDGSTEIICTVQTDATGYYHLDNLSCLANFPQWSNGLPTTGMTAGPGVTYSTFTVGFANPGVNGITTVPQSGGSAGVIDQATGQITAITLVPGADIVEQNLPLDPSGVVYDAVTRQPVAGAQVQILFGGALVPTACISSGQNTVTTGTNGFYQFLLFATAGCPGSGVYTLAVTPPAGYTPGVSTMIPPTAGPYVPTIGGVDPIQVQNTAPSATQATTYYLAINLTLTGSAATSSSNVVNNHIPVDPVTPGQILMNKTTPLVNVARGDLVPYTITAFNTLAAPLTDIAIHDLLPPGFKYRRGSGTVNGVAMEPAVNGRDLTWNAQSFAGNGKNTYKLILVVGSGVSDGAYVNQAYALRAGTAASNIASATVRVIPDPVFDCSDIIGKVFDDVNANGYQDDGEPGIPNVRMATARGLLVTSDADGRFHVACAAIPQADRGSNFAMKLDERTLPSGYRLTTENPRDARVTRGKMTKLNFGATIHRVVRLDITDGAFEGEQLKPEWLARLQAMPEQLKGRPSVLRLAYKQGLAGEELAAARLKAVSAQLRALWDEKACCHALLIEEEIVQPSVVSGEGR